MAIQIVVVDDDEVDRYIVKRAVKSLQIDANVVEFFDGGPFVEVVEDEKRRLDEIGATPPPVLILLDINMPRMGGFEVLKHLKDNILEEDQLMFVTIYSSSAHGEDRADAMNYEFVKDYITKPITAEKLRDLLQNLYTEEDLAE